MASHLIIILIIIANNSSVSWHHLEELISECHVLIESLQNPSDIHFFFLNMVHWVQLRCFIPWGYHNIPVILRSNLVMLPLRLNDHVLIYCRCQKLWWQFWMPSQPALLPFQWSPISFWGPMYFYLGLKDWNTWAQLSQLAHCIPLYRYVICPEVSNAPKQVQSEWCQPL